jgi:ClpP class serine protease
MKERRIKPGEMLAMTSKSIQQDRKGFFWMIGSGATPNERRGDVTIVSIRGELEHHEADAFGGESYEAIIDRVRSAMTGEDCDDSAADEEPVETTPPAAVILCIDSPGGVVAGLSETVAALQRLKAQYKIPIYAYVNEMAASAAYAIACAADEIYCPPSAIIGSIGIISTMVSQSRKDAKDGYDVRLLTSGARKADGHPHAPLTDDALKVEMRRVNKLALAFFKIASKARGVPVETIQSYEAGIFLGPDAVKRGLADGVLSFEDFVSSASTSSTPVLSSGGNQTDRRETQKTKSEAVTMSVALKALIKKTEAAIATTKDPEKLATLYADLSAFKKTKKHVEHTETEEGADDGDDSDDEDKKDDDEDDDSDKAAKSDDKEKADFPKKDKGDDDAEEEEEESESEESEKKAASAALALIQSMTGMKGKRALGGARALFETAINGAKDIAAIKKQNASRAKKELIAGARGKYITRFDAEWLASQPLATVQGFIETRRKQGVIVNTDDSTLLKPKQATPGTEESLPADTLAMIESATASFPGSKAEKDAFRATLVTAQLKTHTETVAKALNGQGRI